MVGAPSLRSLQGRVRGCRKLGLYATLSRYEIFPHPSLTRTGPGSFKRLEEPGHRRDVSLVLSNSAAESQPDVISVSALET